MGKSTGKHKSFFDAYKHRREDNLRKNREKQEARQKYLHEHSTYEYNKERTQKKLEDVLTNGKDSVYARNYDFERGCWKEGGNRSEIAKFRSMMDKMEYQKRMFEQQEKLKMRKKS